MSYHINGWPGTGKRTIGKLVAGRIGGRLLDNHVMLNPAEALFERWDPLHAPMSDVVGEVTLVRADPEAWLTDIFGRITAHPISRIDDLLPWSYSQFAQP